MKLSAPLVATLVLQAVPAHADFLEYIPGLFKSGYDAIKREIDSNNDHHVRLGKQQAATEVNQKISQAVAEYQTKIDYLQGQIKDYKRQIAWYKSKLGKDAKPEPISEAAEITDYELDN